MVVGGGGEGIVREFGKVMYTLLYSKWITNKDLFCIAHGTLPNVMCQPGREKGMGENGYTYICMVESLHCSPEITRTLLISYTPIQNKKFKV